MNNPNMGGNKPGTKNCTTPSRLRDVARLVAQHYKVGQIAKEFGIRVFHARRLVLEAIDAGLVAKLEAGRDETTAKMLERRRGVANQAFDIIERRLREVSADDKEALGASAVNDAFRALDRTEHGAQAPRQAQPTPQAGVTNVLNVFSPEVLRQAQQNGERIWEESSKA